jgi:hypothetical protein
VGGGGSGRGAKSYEREKDWSSINHSILFAPPPFILSPNIPYQLKRVDFYFCSVPYELFFTANMCNKKVMGAHTVLDVQILSCEFIGCDHFLCTFIVSVGLIYAYISVLYRFRVNKMKTKFMCFFIKTTTFM